jgi:uncharacterized membrane protein YbaN (DUF454 family)
VLFTEKEILKNPPQPVFERTLALRLAILLLVWAAEILVALYAGIGYTILIGYLVFTVFLLVPAREKWLDSRFGKLVYGKISNPQIDKFLREMAHSRSYKVTAAVTITVLLALSIYMITSFNFRLIELF